MRVSFRNVMTNNDGWYNTWTYLDEIAIELKVRTSPNATEDQGAPYLSDGEADVDHVSVLDDIVLAL